MDLILRADTRQQMMDALVANGFLKVDEDQNYTTVYGFDYIPWMGSGVLMKQQPQYDVEGNIIQSGVQVPGYFVLARISDPDDQIIPDENDPNKEEQFARSRFVRDFKANATESITGDNIRVLSLNGLEIWNPFDLFQRLSEWGVPGHQFGNGNQF